MIEQDHPEVDDTDFLDQFGIQQYQSLIGALHRASILHAKIPTHETFATPTQYDWKSIGRNRR